MDELQKLEAMVDELKMALDNKTNKNQMILFQYCKNRS